MRAPPDYSRVSARVGIFDDSRAVAGAGAGARNPLAELLVSAP